MQRHFSPSNLISLISNPSEEAPARVRSVSVKLTLLGQRERVFVSIFRVY